MRIVLDYPSGPSIQFQISFTKEAGRDSSPEKDLTPKRRVVRMKVSLECCKKAREFRQVLNSEKGKKTDS